MLVNRIIEDIKVYSYFFDNIVITDARFPNEIESIKNNFDNVISIRINRNETSLKGNEAIHSTEVAMDNYNDYDYIIENNDDKLEEKIKEVIYHA